MKRARRRDSASPSAPPPEPLATPQRASFTIAAVFGVLTLIWGLLLLAQPLPGNNARWMLFLVPDQLLATWWDGPVDIQGAIDRAIVLTVAVLVVASAFLAGRQLLHRTAIRQSLRTVGFVAMATTLGLALQATVIVAVGLAGWLRHPLAPMVIVIGSATLGHLLGLFFSSSLSPARPESNATKQPPVQHWLVNILFIGFASIIVLKAMLPPAEYDVREYHLQAPKEWWLDGRIAFMPHNIYANMPMAAEAHNLLTTMIWNRLGQDAQRDAWWWGALSGKVVIAAHAILMAILIGEAIRALLTARATPKTILNCSGDSIADDAAGWSRVIVLAFPAVVETSSLGLIESAVGAFFAAGMLIAIKYFGRPGSLLELTGLMSLAAAGAIGCKYPAVVLILPLLAGCWWWAVSGGPRPTWSVQQISAMLGISALMLIVGGGIWYLKNLYFTGNPVYPLAANFFGGTTLTPEKIDQWNRGHAVPGYSLSALVDSTIALAWGWRLQGWCALPFALFAIVYVRTRAVAWLVGLGCGAFAVWWLATHRVDRFMIPALPLLFVLAGLGWAELRTQYGLRRVSLMTVGLLFLNIIYVGGPAIGDARILVSLRYLRTDDMRVSDYSRLPDQVRWVNATLNRADNLLVVGDAAVFDYEIPLAYSTTFDRSPLLDLVSGPEPGWREKFAQSGFDYVLVHWGEIERLRSTYGFDDRITRDLFENLIDRGVLAPIEIADKGGSFQVFKVIVP